MCCSRRKTKLWSQGDLRSNLSPTAHSALPGRATPPACPALSSPALSPVKEGLVLPAGTVHGPGRWPTAPDLQLPLPIHLGRCSGAPGNPLSAPWTEHHREAVTPSISPDACPSVLLPRKLEPSGTREARCWGRLHVPGGRPRPLCTEPLATLLHSAW